MNIYKATNLKAERRRYILKRSNKSIYYMLKTCLKNKEQEIYQQIKNFKKLKINFRNYKYPEVPYIKFKINI